MLQLTNLRKTNVNIRYVEPVLLSMIRGDSIVCCVRHRARHPQNKDYNIEIGGYGGP